MKRAANFLQEIKNTDEIVVIFNNDGDGICSCALLNIFLEKTGKRKPYIISQPMPMDKNIIQRIQTTVPDKIIFLDIAADQQQNVLKKIGSICDIMIVDHHQIFKNMNRENMVHYNPRIEEPEVYRSTSYCVYKICSKVLDMSEFLWVAGIGMVSDYNLEDSKDLVKTIGEKYSLDEKLYDTKLGRVADMIAATRATGLLSCEQMVAVVENATLDGFEKSEGADRMVESQSIIEREMSSIMTDAEENAKHMGKMILYNIKSKYNLASSVSTKLSENYQKNLVIVYEKNGNRIKISGRNQAKNINAGKVMQKAAKEADGTGGGHEAAAGATIQADKWEKFLDVLTKLVNK